MVPPQRSSLTSTITARAIFHHRHLSYMSSQVERLLDNLPKKSESALEDIPILDERKIINEIINKIDEA
jgi:hypothetical protein